MRRAAVAGLLLLAAAGCGGRSAQPKDDPGAFAVKVVGMIAHNQYVRAWKDLHSRDQRVAPLAEYVGCELRNPVITAPTKMRVLAVSNESVGLGDGSFVPSKAVDVRLSFRGNFHVTHTVHLVAEHGRWKWILTPWRFRDYRADLCPTNPDSTPPPSSS